MPSPGRGSAWAVGLPLPEHLMRRLRHCASPLRLTTEASTRDSFPLLTYVGFVSVLQSAGIGLCTHECRTVPAVSVF